jgi:hypothetical protein
MTDFLNPGETVVIQNIQVYSPTRTVPSADMFRLWAEAF